jgi:quercetin dioxygenase-like cupin family protein
MLTAIMIKEVVPCPVTFLPARAGRLFGPGITVKVEQGASPSFAVFEAELPPSWEGPPPHLHRNQDEAFYVLDGSVTFSLAGRSQLCTAGSFIFVQRGSPHSFGANDLPARILVMMTPEAIRLVEDIYEASSTGEVEPEAFAAIYERYDSEILPHRR